MPARLRDAYDEEYDDRAVNPGYVLFNPSYPNEDALDIFEAALKNNTLERRTLPPGVLFYLFPGTIHHTPQVTDEEFEPNKIYRVLHGHFNLIPRRTAQDLIEFVNASV